MTTPSLLASIIIRLGQLLLASVVVAAPMSVACADVTLTHVHGLAYSADGKRLFVPSHHGLAVYNGGKWSVAPGPQHDYMGFSATQNRFYSSGHPAPGSGLRNPFGLIRSSDGGKSWTDLGLAGEADFHLLATGFRSNVVLVVNEAPNTRMPRAGLFMTRDEGFVWRGLRAAGLSGKPTSLAAHPEDSQIMAVATNAGLFLSTDGGENFRPVASGEVLATSFDLAGKELWYSSHGAGPVLTRLDWRSGETRAVSLPPLPRDAVAYIAQNPANRSEYAIATFRRNVFVSRDGGKRWTEIAHEGVGLAR